MMHKFLLLLVSCFISFEVASQCATPPNAIVNGDFSAYTPPSSASSNNYWNNFYNNSVTGWYAAFGSPQIYNSSGNNYAAFWTKNEIQHSNVYHYGEGIFTCFNFVAGSTYQISFRTKSNTTNTSLTLKACTGLTPNSTTLSTGEYYVSPVTEEHITNTAATSAWTTHTITYTPTSNFTQLYVYGTTPDINAQKWTFVDDVIIEEVACGVTSSFTLASSVEGPCSLVFQASSTANQFSSITGYQWTFGNFGSATGQNVTHTFLQSGTYNVCLTTTGIMNGSNETCTSTICEDVSLRGCVPTPCGVQPDFITQSQSGGGIVFTQQSQLNATTTLMSYFWDFGDGNTSTDPSPVHTYSQPGTYTVCLHTIGFNGLESCCNSHCEDIIIKAPSNGGEVQPENSRN